MNEKVKEFYNRSSPRIKKMFDDLRNTCRNRFLLTDRAINYLLEIIIDGIDKNNQLLIREILEEMDEKD